MLDGIHEAVNKLMDTTTAKEKIESELAIARNIQMGLLPSIVPTFPRRPEFELYALIESAKVVGGDFYDFYFIDDNKFFFVIGDVSGKGVPASLFMAITRTLLKVSSTKESRPDEIMARVNSGYCSANTLIIKSPFKKGDFSKFPEGHLHTTQFPPFQRG